MIVCPRALRDSWVAAPTHSVDAGRVWVQGSWSVRVGRNPIGLWECSDGRVATSELALVEPDVWKPDGVPDASVFQPPRKGVGTPLRVAARKGEAVCKSCGGRCVGLLHGGPCASAFLVAKKRQGVAFVYCS